MFYDDDDFDCDSPRRGRPASPLVLSDFRHENPENIKAWRDGLASIKAGNVDGMLRFLSNAKGEARLINTRGGDSRGPIAKAILALREDPGAWRRLGEMCWRSREESPTPFSASPLQVLWAANPAGLASAARLWRQASSQNSKWWTSPFIGRGYEGPPSLAHGMIDSAHRVFNLPDSYGRPSGIGGEPASAGGDSSERFAIFAILKETARACIEQLWPQAELSGAKRLAGETCWSRGGSDWGLSWHGAMIELAPDPDRPAATPLMSACMDLIGEGIAQGPEAADLACRKIIIGADGESLSHSIESASLAAWARAESSADRGLPFLSSDWLPPRKLFSLCDAAGVSDHGLARWLAIHGRGWSTPASFMAPSPQSECSINHAAPAWQGYQGSMRSAERLPWTPLEWALVSRPQAAILACMQGAILADGAEDILLALANAGGVGAAAFGSAHAAAQACRVAEASPSPAAPPASRSRLSRTL